MRRVGLLFFIIVIFLFAFFIVIKKNYEKKLEEAFHSYAIDNGISEEKIEETKLIYFSKSNYYEYNIYIKDVERETHFNFSYTLPESQLKTYLNQKIDSEGFSTGAYIEGSIVDLSDKKVKLLLEKSK